jgi:hypothetical protein
MNQAGGLRAFLARNTLRSDGHRTKGEFGVLATFEADSLRSVYYVYGNSEQGATEKYARLPDSVL